MSILGQSPVPRASFAYKALLTSEYTSLQLGLICSNCSITSISVGNVYFVSILVSLFFLYKR